MLARPSLNDLEDILAGSPCSLYQLINEFLGLCLLGHKLQEGILQRNEGPTQTSSVTRTAEQQKLKRKVNLD